MAKDKKAKAAEKKARVAVKQGKKAAQKEKKGKTKGRNDDDSDADDVDLDAVLAEYAKQQAQFLKVTEVSCEPPSPRASSTLIASPSNEKELFLFGGEYFNGAMATFYNDLFIYNIDRDDWRQVNSPNSPLPRSGHAWCRGGNAGGVYLFGGEFSSPKQGTFYHYNDFWRLDPLSREWTRLEGKGKSPPARSGHRMTCFKNYIVLFGGFQDTSQQTKYLQDLWIYDCQSFVWFNPALPPVSPKPDARSSFSFLPHDSGAVICGGYSRVKATVTAGKQKKGAAPTTKSMLKPVVHQDTWFLRIAQPAIDVSGNAPPTVRWERRKKPANPLNPTRAGATMTHHKGRGILFGGVHDVEESEEGMDSEFFDTLFAWTVERNRYFPLNVRRPRATTKKRQPELVGRRGRKKAGEEELLRNLAALEVHNPITDADCMQVDEVIRVDEDKLPTRPRNPLTMEMPHRRFNSQLAVQDDVLFIYGGTFEQGDREYTFDDMYAIDLGRLDGVREVFKRELENWQGSEEEDSDDDEDEDEGLDEDDSSESADDIKEARFPSSASNISDSVMTEDFNVTSHDGDDLDVLSEDAESQQASSLMDTLPHPRPFESLREFYTRASNQWQGILLDRLQEQGAAMEAMSVKELKKAAFDKAEEKWWDCREEIRDLEDQQEEAGIGEVMSIADRGGDGGGAAARRR
ncbi:MAG: hypothetical protein M1832_002382 [Thelocarpon impressellum]|nr:MAG: hypothetical protein M1832_002382 [Thelocarpon impressellum]